MKKWMYMFLACAFAACQENDDASLIPEKSNQEKTYTLGFELGGEWIQTAQEPLSKSEVKENKDLYWMEIWYSDKDKDNFSFYGKGVFDNPDSMKVEFKDGYKYCIQMAYVKNGKDKIWKDIATREYREPITTWENYKYVCNNNFTVTTNSDRFSTVNPTVYLQEEGNNKRLTHSELTGRYYGRVDNFIPENNIKISLEMYKVSYGIQVKINGLTDGTLNVRYRMGDDINFTFHAADGTSQQQQYPELQWADDINNIATVMNNKEGGTVMSKQTFYFSWTNGNGLVNLDLGSKDFWLERNKMNLITVNLSQLPSVNNGVSFEFETTPMTEKEAGSIEGSIE